MPTIKLYFPPLRQFSQVLERMKAVASGRAVSIKCGNEGLMVLGCEDEGMRIETFFKDLALNGAVTRASQQQAVRGRGVGGGGGKGGGEGENGDGLVEVRVDAKKLSAVLHCRVLNLLTCICCVVEGQCLIVYGKLREKRGTVTYFIPIQVDTAG